MIKKTMLLLISFVYAGCNTDLNEETTVTNQRPESSNDPETELVDVNDGFRAIPCERLLQVQQTNMAPAQANEWSVDTNFVLDGGPGKDGIPSVDNPDFTTISAINEQNFVDEGDFVVGVSLGGSPRAYPHPVMDWHEIVNDRWQTVTAAVTYCPLTGSAIVWDRVVNGTETEFGVSGLLFNNNLIPYDRNTDSNWSQMSGQSVNGEQINSTINTHPVVEMNWRSWQAMYPGSDVLSTDTGSSRNYGQFPYGSYRITENLLFPASIDDQRLHKKERVFGVANGDTSKTYVIADFPAAKGVTHDVVGEKDIVVAGSCDSQFAVAYNRKLPDGTLLSFDISDNPLPSLFIDDEGTEWDIFGKGISGARSGEQLVWAEGYTAYWFAWSIFFPNPEIVELDL